MTSEHGVPLDDLERSLVGGAHALDRIIIQIRQGDVEYAWSLLDTLQTIQKTQKRALELLRS